MRWPKRTGERGAASAPSPALSENMPAEGFTRVFVTVDSFLVIFLAFAFAFGNGWTTALRLGVSPYIAPFMQPAVDLAVVGLMVAIRYLAIHGWTDEQLKMPRRWLRFFGALTLAMNVALPMSEQDWGRAAWDAIGPVLLIAWSELAPWLLRAIYSVRAAQALPVIEEEVAEEPEPVDEPEVVQEPSRPAPQKPTMLTVRAGTAQEVVTEWLREWDRKGRTYGENPAAALRSQMKQYPAAFKLTNKVSDRWIGELCKVTWDQLYEGGELKTPRELELAVAR